jgi:hypothetical protein
MTIARTRNAPRIPLAEVRGAAAEEIRAEGRELLARYDAYPSSMIGGGSSAPRRVTEMEYRSREVTWLILDPAAVASQNAWHDYWHGRGRGAMRDAALMDAAPPRPSRGVAAITGGTWEQLRRFLETPQQTSILDLLAA